MLLCMQPAIAQIQASPAWFPLLRPSRALTGPCSSVAFSTPSSVLVGNAPQGIVAHHFDGDGMIDLVVASRSADRLWILKGNGDATFSTLSTPLVGHGPLSVVSVDLN